MNLGPTYLNNFDGVQNLASIIVSKREDVSRQMLTEFAQVPTSKALDELSKAVFENSTRMNVPKNDVDIERHLRREETIC
jgi:uncharacterized hydantoinase/oxoprolinase family protein